MASSYAAQAQPLAPQGPKLPLMIHVTAPATLPAGYTFEAQINGDESKIVTVEVPEGGVEEGQVFLTPLPEAYVGARLDAPTGRWKSGLFECCATGWRHPSLWCSLCCTQIAMAQVMTRMQLTWLGNVGASASTSRTFSVVVLLVAAFFVYSTALDLAALPYNINETPTYMAALRFAGNFLFTVWSIYALCRTRKHLRERYQIPAGRCGNACEDLCCAVWCGCCSTAQMLRHTGEYETYPGICCSPTGHPPGAPLVI